MTAPFACGLAVPRNGIMAPCLKGAWGTTGGRYVYCPEHGGPPAPPEESHPTPTTGPDKPASRGPESPGPATEPLTPPAPPAHRGGPPAHFWVEVSVQRWGGCRWHVVGPEGVAISPVFEFEADAIRTAEMLSAAFQAGRLSSADQRQLTPPDVKYGRDHSARITLGEVVEKLLAVASGVAGLHALAADLAVALKGVEWSGDYQTWPACPLCGARGPDVPVPVGDSSRSGEHVSGCVLAAALANARGAGLLPAASGDSAAPATTTPAPAVPAEPEWEYDGRSGVYELPATWTTVREGLLLRKGLVALVYPAESAGSVEDVDASSQARGRLIAAAPKVAALARRLVDSIRDLAAVTHDAHHRYMRCMWTTCRVVTCVDAQHAVADAIAAGLLPEEGL